ncbi:MAG: glycosyltransferase family 2 protein [bacterium]|nr:glycosyltransferase family 2 protein [bacterium]
MRTISILIQTKNEEQNLRATLESCSWAREVFVVDNYSTDQTVEIAKTFPNVAIVEREFDGYARQKNWGLANLPITGEWVFILDADERMTPDLVREIEQIATSTESKECWYVNRRFIFLGRWIRHAGWYPSWNMRFFKKGTARYEERGVDEHMITSGRIGYLQNDLIHEDHKGLDAWIAKHNRYSTLEAHERLSKNTSTLKGSIFSKDPVERKRAMKNLFYRLPSRPFLRFFIMYVLQLGFLDGYPGFVFCVLRGVQEFHISVKMRELRRV